MRSTRGQLSICYAGLLIVALVSGVVFFAGPGYFAYSEDGLFKRSEPLSSGSDGEVLGLLALGLFLPSCVRIFRLRRKPETWETVAGALLISSASLPLLVAPECGEILATLRGESALSYAGFFAACALSAACLVLLLRSER